MRERDPPFAEYIVEHQSDRERDRERRERTSDEGEREKERAECAVPCNRESRTVINVPRSLSLSCPPCHQGRIYAREHRYMYIYIGMLEKAAADCVRFRGRKFLNSPQRRLLLLRRRNIYAQRWVERERERVLKSEN